MSTAATPQPANIPQGFFPSTADRMPLMPREAMSVSYTHLTLPTIYSV